MHVGASSLSPYLYVLGIPLLLAIPVFIYGWRNGFRSVRVIMPALFFGPWVVTLIGLRVEDSTLLAHDQQNFILLYPLTAAGMGMLVLMRHLGRSRRRRS